MPLSLTLAVRETVAGHRLGALEERWGGGASPPSNAPLGLMHRLNIKTGTQSNASACPCTTSVPSDNQPNGAPQDRPPQGHTQGRRSDEGFGVAVHVSQIRREQQRDARDELTDHLDLQGLRLTVLAPRHQPGGHVRLQLQERRGKGGMGRFGFGFGGRSEFSLRGGGWVGGAEGGTPPPQETLSC